MQVNDHRLPFFYVFVVWGDEYVKMLLEVTLPCLLAPGNLPALSNLEESRLLIITTPNDALRIANAPILSLIRRLITTEISTPQWIDCGMPYHLKAARGHMAAAAQAAENDGYCVYLAPDFIFSNSSLLHLEHLAREGKEAVMVPGIRLTKESFLQELRERNLLKPGERLCLSSRALVDIALEHIHEENQRSNWDHPYFSHSPVVCTWNIPKERGLLIRAFHLHPILVSMRGQPDLSWLDSETIDGDFLGYNITDWSKIHVETDSDNLVMFSLTKRDERRMPAVPNTASVEQVGSLAWGVGVNPLHRFFFTKAIRLHCDDLSTNWHEVEGSTGRLAYRILRQGQKNLSIGTYLQTIAASSLLLHLIWRVRYRLFRALPGLPNRIFKWIEERRRKKNHVSSRIDRTVRSHVLEVRLSDAHFSALVNLQSQTGRKSLDEVIVDAVGNYQYTLARGKSPNDNATSGIVQSDDLSACRQTDETRLVHPKECNSNRTEVS